ncbi:MAG: hypothetical protein QXJ74_10115 [Nitrososphaera sp.]
MSGIGKEPKSVAIGNLRLDAETYRSISMMAYHKGVPVEFLVGEMLKKHLAIQGFLKNDFDIVHREIIKPLQTRSPTRSCSKRRKSSGRLQGRWSY